MKKILILSALFTLSAFVCLLAACGKTDPVLPDVESGAETPDCGTSEGEDSETPGDEESSLEKFTGITFPGKTVRYDGNEHRLEISGQLLAGAQVVYENNAATNAGTYSAGATVTKENYETLELSASLVINKAIFTGITFESKTFWGDGPHSLTIEGELPVNSQVSYENNTAMETGVYPAKATITNPNYETLVLQATMTVKSVPAVAADVVNGLLGRPDPWQFLPEVFSPEGMAYETAPVSDFSTDVAVSSIGKKAIGKQFNVLYEGLNDATTALKYADGVFAIGETIASLYQGFINENPEQYAEFTGEAGGFRFKILLDGENSMLLAGNGTFSIELSCDAVTGIRTGRMQMTDGIALKYQSREDYLSFAVSVTYAGVGNLKMIEFVRNENGTMAGYLREFTGTSTKNLKTTASIYADDTLTVIVSDKRETDDLLIDGYEEVYSSATGEFLGGEVRETVKIVDYDTYWFPLWSVSGFASVRVENVKNGLNADTVYINGKSSPFAVKNVGGLGLDTASRRYDVEMRHLSYCPTKSPIRISK